ncbi:type VI secretion system ATPase TssH [Sulfurimonas sp.]|uniref:type VI secretion system ATPase TssH n=1 Tax=Sulfurimonas sp. TaxID=2022749 RepID=UPI002B4710F3|nr:type VI secretion system ATPase TssH [Sulfurimonas sp.]
MKLELPKLIQKMDMLTKTDLENAGYRCVSRGGNEVLIEDFLYVMLENPKSVLNAVLTQYDISQQKMQEALQHGVKISSSESASPVLSPLLITWLEDAYIISHVTLEVLEISETALILSIFDNASRYANTSYFKLFADVSIKEVKSLLEGLNSAAIEKITATQKGNLSIANELEKYTTNLTQQAMDGKIDPVLCRDEEIKQAIDIVLRRRKNNPILVGEAGVGKTAIVEGLALKIVNKDVPDYLYNAQILSLDLGALQAGASVKGEFERRLQAVIKEIQNSAEFIILFIDEAHTLIGAGGNEGGSDAANILKPALARGNLRTIAATTWLEYRKYFEKDPALSRRFQKIDLMEPSVNEAITILRGIADKYEDEHNVYIEDEALVAAAQLSARYITGRQLPDKAIDVLDTACANVKISKSNIPFALQKIQNEIIIINRTITSYDRDAKHGVKDYSKKIKILEKEKKILEKEANKVETSWQKQKMHLEKIMQFRKEGKETELKKEHIKFKALQEKGTYIFENVSFEQVAEVIASWTGIPLGSMVQEQTKLVLSLDEKLREEIIGQDEALSHLSTFLQISTAGMKNEKSPAGVFLLVGPSGVGKTETARNVAKLMFGGEKFLTTINMTEFQEKHTISRLIGSPPGYVGYGEGGQLTDPVRIKPYSVVLLDEIEKAHPDILNLFYQIFDRGVVNDGEGREIDFKNTVIFMTSNLATQEITSLCAEDKNIEMQDLINAITPTLSSYLKPALLGRMNVIPYINLSDVALKEIVKLKLNFIEKQLTAKEVKFKYEEELLDRIVFLSNAMDTGARNIDLIINTNIMPVLSKTILECTIEQSSLKTVNLYLDKNNKISVKSTREINKSTIKRK